MSDNPTTRPSQTAREAAADFVRAWDGDEEYPSHTDSIWIREGRGDDEPLVQAFARFERDTEKRVRESIEAARPGPISESVAWLRACSDWLLANDLDMQMPSGILDTDPLDLADALDQFIPESLASEANVERVALREKVARAFDERWPFYMPGPQNIDGHRVARRFDWDSAPAFHQSECYEKADIALAAIFGRAALAALERTTDAG